MIINKIYINKIKKQKFQLKNFIQKKNNFTYTFSINYIFTSLYIYIYIYFSIAQKINQHICIFVHKESFSKFDSYPLTQHQHKNHLFSLFLIMQFHHYIFPTKS